MEAPPKRIEFLHHALDEAYKFGRRAEREELLWALRDTPFRLAILKALAKYHYEEDHRK